MKDKVKVIIFDADDTLWDNQTYFDRAEDVFTEELKEYGTAEELSEELYKTESANMPILGYGAKAVCISMMETALRVSDCKVPGENLSQDRSLPLDTDDKRGYAGSAEQNQTLWA